MPLGRSADLAARARGFLSISDGARHQTRIAFGQLACLRRARASRFAQPGGGARARGRSDHRRAHLRGLRLVDSVLRVGIGRRRSGACEHRDGTRANRVGRGPDQTLAADADHLGARVPAARRDRRKHGCTDAGGTARPVEAARRRGPGDDAGDDVRGSALRRQFARHGARRTRLLAHREHAGRDSRDVLCRLAVLRERRAPWPGGASPWMCR